MSNQVTGEILSEALNPTAQVIARFTCGKIHKVILATNDLSIYLPSCAKKKKKTKTKKKTKQNEFNNSSVRVKTLHEWKKKKKKKKVIKKSHPPHKKQMPQLIGSRQYAPKKLSARTISKQCGLASAHGARGRKRAKRVKQRRLCWDSEPAVLPHRMCVSLCVWSAQKYHRLSLSLSLSPSLTCYTRLLLQTSTLQHGCAALKLQMAHALHVSSPPPPPPHPPSSSHQLSRNKNLSVGKIVETEERGIEREGRAERTVTKQASLLPKINLLSTRGYYPIPSRA